MLQKANWVHLDCKGVIPASAEKFRRFLEYLHGLGFNGLVLELEDRIDWQTWPGTFRPGFSRNQWKEIVKGAKMKIIPLIQTAGHLEWLLRHERYADFRDDGKIANINFYSPSIRDKLKDWIDEVLAFFQDIEYLHIGADEVSGLEDSPERMEQYISHIESICAYVASKGVKPIIWGDVFIENGLYERLSRLPPETVPVAWKYSKSDSFGVFTIEEAVSGLRRAGHNVLTADAICSAWREQGSQLQPDPADRFANIRWMAEKNEKLQCGVIHTVWGRSNSLWMPYTAWQGLVPIFIMAGNREKWDKHPFKPFFENLHAEPEEVLQIPVMNEFEKGCVEWWYLALKYYFLFDDVRVTAALMRGINVTRKYMGCDPATYKKRLTDRLNVLPSKIDVFEREIKEFWEKYELSDGEEYVEGRLCTIRAELKYAIQELKA